MSQVAIESFRMILYALGLLASVAMAARLFAVQHRLARLFGTMMLVWALNCGVFLTLLVVWSFTGHGPVWQAPMLTLNALLLAVAPITLLFMYPPGARDDGGDAG